MRILGIESSCDETAASVVIDGTTVESNTIASTKDLFSEHGGVIPEDAARRQVECILPVLHASLREAGCSSRDLDAIAVTSGPGLLGSLLVGTITARTLSSLWDVPIIGVHHTLGHLSSTWLEADSDPQFPIITLSASGGHTDLWYRDTHTKGTLLGRTRDDAAGEAFDKGAAMLDLPYPGGPSIAKEAEQGDASALPFPIALKGEETLDFSFSGLKTALRYTLQKQPSLQRADLCASYQEAICLQLTDRLQRAWRKYPATKELHLVGGVSANTRLRSMVREHCRDQTIRHPKHLRYCTDNAAMIAAAGYVLHCERGKEAYTAFETKANLPLESVVA